MPKKCNHAPVAVHAYADDFQVYLSFSPSRCANEEQAVQVMQDCVADIKSWARQHSLMLNDGKTELLVLGTRQQLSKINISHLRVGDAIVAASTSVRNLGSYLTMATHVTKTCSAAFFHLHNIRQIRTFYHTKPQKYLFTRSLRVKSTIVIVSCMVFQHIRSLSCKGYRTRQRA